MKSLEKIFGLIIGMVLMTSLSACSEDDDTTDKKKGGNIHDVLKTKVIYGEDNRHDLYAETNPNLLAAADATVALISQSEIVEESTTHYRVLSVPFATSRNLPLCTDERFYEQNVAAFCSGFLVKPNVIVTAGHCIMSQGTPNSDCTQTRFVFGYGLKTATMNPDIVDKNEVYSCSRIIERKQMGNGADFAIIELDRAVTNHTPLALRTTGEPQIDGELVVIGHPQGLPTKIAGGAHVREILPSFFRANLDTYGGNSGSAVLNTHTGAVEGILVRGERDFIVRNGCMASNVCPDNGCRGEDVTRISELLPFLQ